MDAHGYDTTMLARGRKLKETIEGVDNIMRMAKKVPADLRQKHRNAMLSALHRAIVPEVKAAAPPYPWRELKGPPRGTGASRRSTRAAFNRKHGLHISVGSGRTAAKPTWYIIFEIVGVAQYNRYPNPYPYIVIRKHNRYIVSQVNKAVRELEVQLMRELRERNAAARRVPPKVGPQIALNDLVDEKGRRRRQR